MPKLQFAAIVLSVFVMLGAPINAALARNSQVNLTIEEGVPAGGQVDHDTTVGSMVVIRVTSDRTAVVYMEEFNLGIQVGPHEPADMIVDASRPGRFPLTLRTYGGDPFDGEPLLYLNIFPD
ncbi:MAG: hypothetical protein AAF563_10480 [Pseudomonadota bacterium]